MSNYQSKRVLVLGLGISGRSAVKFLLKRGSFVTGADRNPDILNGDEELTPFIGKQFKTIADSAACNIKEFDFLVVSPGIPHTHPLYEKAMAAGIGIVGEIELACGFIPQKCLAVTGTNGKTTVTLMVAHILNHAGMSARALGNVGTPLTSAIDSGSVNENEIFVIELSSFQLDTLHTRFIDAGVILNITPDHLDRYGSLEAYAESKAHLYSCLKAQGKLFVEDRCLKEFSFIFSTFSMQSYGYSDRNFIHTDTKNVYVNKKKVFDLPENLQGKRTHDAENLMAAYALCQYVGVTEDQFCAALQTFKKPSHRIEFVRTVRGVHYYDDSKGTNIDAVIRAVEVIGGNIVLIAGGVDKGASYALWLDAIAHKLKFICAIGNAKEKIKCDLGSHIPMALFATLDEAVIHAASVSKEGDTVLLSPGCSSYDMFRDYEHRGREFQRIVNEL
ncbi:MAG: UDP-N-acetylmuramoyl-L-alanine--D-glutamate ligase [Parachlamydiaceae bacterium]|nr:UDP-N-acetylmuramoyl-L-alanine--D-glutamate ligase [Parachlamydiaceae bacterium]